MQEENYGFGTSFKFSYTSNRFLRLSYENATRIPQSIEYFGDGDFLLGNPYLKPEQSHNINLGFYSNIDRKKDWWLDVSTFYRHVQNQIIQQPIYLFFSQYRIKTTHK
ncbi:MAG: TonB-dependent receptor [Bacteroidota bacterium]